MTERRDDMYLNLKAYCRLNFFSSKKIELSCLEWMECVLMKVKRWREEIKDSNVRRRTVKEAKADQGL